MKRKAAEAQREERRTQVAKYLKLGLTYREMAERLEVSLGTISEDVKIIMSRWQRYQIMEVADYITLELQRVETAHQAIWGDVLNGRLTAIDRFCKLGERRDKLHGIGETIHHEIREFDIDDWKSTRQERLARIAELED